ncbi:MAG: pyrroline-5-carboxylate reductase [Proteobacteria bacterium]|nr:pyrroline-5-carboxylate reductase [Pseudomonadota bacterium]
MVTTQYEIGVIGAGNAAEGIVHGILRNTLLFADRVIAADPSEARRDVFRDRFKIDVTADNRELVANSHIIILAVKPQQYIGVCQEIADLIGEQHLVVSIMAGVSTASIEALFPLVPVRVVRAMPNLPIHVGAGMAGLCKGRHAQEVDLLHAQRIFEAGGRSIVIEDESHMDAVTAVSGSGPAYVFLLIECLAGAGVASGLPPELAERLARATVIGSGELARLAGESAGTLRENVTSPGGTTAAALDVLMADDGLAALMTRAVAAATRRSRELGN